MKLSDYIQIIEDQFNVTEINPHHTFKEDLGADSLDMVELISNIEDRADIEFTDAMLAEESQKVGDLYMTVLQLTNFLEDGV
jgi:acyl carrier protein